MFAASFTNIFVAFCLLSFCGSFVKSQLFGQKPASNSIFGHLAEPTKPTVNPSALSEVEKIRESLSNAFKVEEDTAAKGIIVQPSWTAAKNAVSKPTKVTVTDQSLKEVADIRNLIKDAISHDSYAKGNPGEKENVANADRELGMEFRMKKLASGASVGSTHEVVGAGVPDVDDEQHVANVVDTLSVVLGDAMNYRSRDTLVLQAIEEDLSFGLGHDVSEWKSVLHAGKLFLFGVREADLVLVEQSNGVFRTKMRFEIEGAVTSVETFSYWDADTRQQEGVVLAAVNDCIYWFRGFQAVEFWKWKIGKPITAIRFMRIDEGFYLAVSTGTVNQSLKSSLNIYEFKLCTREFWIAQRIAVNVTSADIGFLATGRDNLLVIPQDNSAVVYSFNSKLEADDDLRFRRTATLESKGVDTIAVFQMGGYSYIALGGYEPKIFRYYRGEFVLQTIFGQNFGFVNKFLPIPARTFRDDLVLLVQHIVTFDTHNLTALEVVVWDGHRFQASLPVPCRSGAYEYDTGVGCLLDVERPAGIHGATVFGSGRNISILVPRHNATSGLFYIHTGFLEKNTETVELQELFNYLKASYDEQMKFIAEIERFLANAEHSMRVVKTPELHYDGEYSKLFVNDHEWSEQDSQEDLHALFEELEALDGEVKKLQADLKAGTFVKEAFFDQLQVDDVEVQEMLVSLLNGEPLVVKDDHLRYDGTIEFGGQFEARSAETHTEMNREELVVEGNVDFDEINGIPWVEFVSSLVMKNFPVDVEELHVSGNVTFANTLQLGSLNNLSFPNDFLWQNGPQSSVVRARKNFAKTLAVNAIDSGGPINGVNPFDVITLSEDQNIPGLTTFAQLEVSESLELNGTVIGKTLGNFLANPSLLESNFIQSECIFSNLQVANGSIQLLDLLNGYNLTTLAENVLNRNDLKLEITSKKVFKEFSSDGDVVLAENLLSGVALDRFVTKDTEQELSIEKINGNLFVNFLQLGGLFNAIDVADLAVNTVKIDENSRDTGVDLVLIELTAPEVTVVSELNAASVDSYVAFDSLSQINLKNVSFGNLFVETSTRGDGTLNGVDLRSLSSENSEFAIDKLILESGLHAETVNAADLEFLLSFLEQIDDIPKMVIAGEFTVDKLIVNGNVNARTLNGEKFDETKVLWLNRPNFIRARLQFEDEVRVNGDLSFEGEFNGRNFSEMIADFVFKDADSDSMRVSSTKTFEKPLKVFKNVETKKLNAIPFEKIAPNNGLAEFSGFLTVKGDFHTQKVDVGEFLNAYRASDLPNLCAYNATMSRWVFGGQFTFLPGVRIEDLHVLGSLNDITSLPELIESLTSKNEISILKGRTVFSGPVRFEKGANIKHLNGFDLEKFFRDVIYVEDDDEVQIAGEVVFKRPVQGEHLTVDGLLRAENLAGVDLPEMVANTLRVGEDAEVAGSLKLASGSLDGTFFRVSSVNGCDLEDLVTLHTAQNISKNVEFSSVQLAEAMTVLGDVNGVNLTEARRNTLMTSGNQTITTPLTLSGFRVLKNLDLLAPINNHDLQSAVPLKGDITLHSPVSFQQLNAANVHSSDLISGLNITAWAAGSLWREHASQSVLGNWTFDVLNVRNATTGNGMVNSVQMEAIKAQCEQTSRSLAEDFKRLRADFDASCLALKDVIRGNNGKLHFLRYFEEINGWEEEDGDVNIVFPFVGTRKGRSYLLTNVGCASSVYQWRRSGFVKLFSFESGPLDQVLSSVSEDQDVLISTIVGSKPKCAVRPGVHVWLFTGRGVVPMNAYPSFRGEVYQLHHDPMVGKTYAVDRARNALLELGNSTETEILELTSGEYRFLPLEAGLGIALSDGKRLSVIDQSTRRRFRGRRETNVKEYILGVAKDLIKEIDTELIRMRSVGHAQTELSESFQADLQGVLDEMKQDKKALDVSHLSDAELSAIRVALAIWSSLKEVEKLGGSSGSGLEVFHEFLLTALSDILSDISNRREDDILARTKRFKEEILPALGATDDFATAIDPILGADAPDAAGFLVTENTFIPDRLSGEVVALKVGSPGNKQVLLAVTEYQEQFVSGETNAIKIYSDILQGLVFQTIQAQRPRSLTTLNIRDETVLAFVDNGYSVRALAYRGIQGFVEVSQFKLSTPVRGLTAMRIPPNEDPDPALGANCWQGLLIAVTQNRVRLFKAIMHDNCRYLEDLQCS